MFEINSICQRDLQYCSLIKQLFKNYVESLFTDIYGDFLVEFKPLDSRSKDTKYWWSSGEDVMADRIYSIPIKNLFIFIHAFLNFNIQYLWCDEILKLFFLESWFLILECMILKSLFLFSILFFDILNYYFL